MFCLKEYIISISKGIGSGSEFHKSGVFYSSNVHEGKKLDLYVSLGVSQALDTSRYLGLPALLERNKKSVFSYV